MIRNAVFSHYLVFYSNAAQLFK